MFALQIQGSRPDVWIVYVFCRVAMHREDQGPSKEIDVLTELCTVILFDLLMYKNYTSMVVYAFIERYIEVVDT